MSLFANKIESEYANYLLFFNNISNLVHHHKDRNKRILELAVIAVAITSLFCYEMAFDSIFSNRKLNSEVRWHIPK